MLHSRFACIVHAIAAAAIFGSVPSCKLFKHDGGRFVVREGAGATSELEAHRIETAHVDHLHMGATDAIPYPNGAGMVIVDASGFMRMQGGRTGVITCIAPPSVSLFAIDDAGNRVLFKTTAPDKRETLHFMDLTSCAETTLDVRYAYRGDVMRDGSEAAVGAFPSTCVSSSLDHCPITLYRMRPPGASTPTEIIRGGARANYQPRYFPGRSIVFQTTELDTTCDGTVDGCRHDLVAIPINGGPISPLELIRKGAIAAAISGDGKRIAYLSYLGAETSCRGRLPCKTMTLKVGDAYAKDDAKDVSIAKGRVSNVIGHPFSLDAREVSFSTGESYTPEVCRVDGTHCATFSGHSVGWLK